MASEMKILAGLGFSNRYAASEFRSLANSMPPYERCGIYVLHFHDGDLYVGQTINVVRRYSDHCKTYDDIEEISFKSTTPDKLNKEEQTAIHTLEKAGYHLRNIIHTSITYTPSPFDEILSPEEQNRWNEDLSYHPTDGERIDHPEIRNKYKARYRHFEKLPYMIEVQRILREYIHLCIPAFKQSEMNYWCCSCPLEKRPGEITIYTRINIYWQEVFTIGLDGDRLFFSWHLANSPIRISSGNSHFYRPEVYDALIDSEVMLLNHQYKPGGQDQVNLHVNGAQNALDIIHNPNIQSAIRLFNLRLTKKGANVYYKYHCFDLADKLIQ